MFKKNISILSSNCTLTAFLTTNYIKQNKYDLIKLLSPLEIKLMNSYKQINRRLQYIGGRILLKYLTLFYNKYPTDKKIYFQQIEILKNKNDSPYLLCKKIHLSNTHFSLAHKDHFIFAVLSKKSVGCDIEKLTSKIFKIEKRFLLLSEKIIIQKYLKNFNSIQTNDLENIIYLTFIWTSKEAIFKCLNKNNLLTLMKKIRLIQIDKLNSKFFYQQFFDLFYSTHTIFENYVFTIVKKDPFNSPLFVLKNRDII